MRRACAALTLALSLLGGCGGKSAPQPPAEDVPADVPADAGADVAVVDVPDVGVDTAVPPPDVTAPTWPADAALGFSAIGADRVTVDWPAADDDVGVVAYRLEVDGKQLEVAADQPLQLEVDGLQAATEYTFRVEAGDAAGNWSVDGPSGSAQTTLPPDPSLVAPALDETVATEFVAATAFLYDGPAPLQLDVVPGAIEAPRVAVVRGRVADRQGAPMAGVEITQLNHPELGKTYSREDGGFDLAVNGGDELVLEYRRAGFLPVQRRILVPWRDYASLGETVLVPADAAANPVDLGLAGAAIARANEASDADGTRTATLYLPSGVEATMQLPDGSSQPLDTVTLRLTEFTVGDSGPAAMPAPLPPTSVYTYAVDLQVDEAVAAGATGVEFSAPVAFYVENFLELPVGLAVPIGYLQRDQAAWAPMADGRVIAVLGVDAGLALVDLDGSGSAAGDAELAAVGMDDTERAELAGLYATGTTLWRFTTTHLSSYDCNYGVALPGGASRCGCGRHGGDLDDPCRRSGSIIACQNQTLSEVLPLAGTPASLVYHSARVPGRKVSYGATIRLSRDVALHPDLKRIIRRVYVAGRSFVDEYDPEPDLVTTFTWDGLDAYGRAVQGDQPLTVAIEYVYQAYYALPPDMAASFGYPSGQAVPGDIPARQDLSLVEEWRGSIGTWDARAQRLGGWSLNVHHAYEPRTGVLYLGSGERRTFSDLPQVIETVGGGGEPCSPMVCSPSEVPDDGDGGPVEDAHFQWPRDVATAPDGSTYVVSASRLRHIDTAGTVHAAAGGGSVWAGEWGDGWPALDAELAGLSKIEVDAAGRVFMALEERVARLDSDGMVRLVAGGGDPDDGRGLDGPATQARLQSLVAIALAPDGTLYLAQPTRISRVGPDGIIRHYGGLLEPPYTGFVDGNPAPETNLKTITDIALAADGSLYVAQQFSGGTTAIRRIAIDGVVSTVAGGNLPGPTGDGGPAIDAHLKDVESLAFDHNGHLFLAAYQRIRRVTPDGLITTAAGGDSIGFEGDGGAAANALVRLPKGIAFDPDDRLWIADTNNLRIRRVRRALPMGSGGEIHIPSGGGSMVYVFDAQGRHLRTEDELTGVTLLSFVYLPNGLLSQLVDREGLVTAIERDAEGLATAVVGPYGQRTELSTNADGWLTELQDPAGSTVGFSYHEGGLLATMTDPRDGVYTFAYDALGRLEEDRGPDDHTLTLTRAETAAGYEVESTTAEGVVLRYAVERPQAGVELRHKVFPTGHVRTLTIEADGARSTVFPDGVEARVEPREDTRWGTLLPLLSGATLTTPSGLTAQAESDRTVVVDSSGAVVSRTDTVTANGRTATRVYDAATRTITATTPAGRVSVTKLDELGRVVETQWGDLAPATYQYDEDGRLVLVRLGDAAAGIEHVLAYGLDGWLEAITDPLDQTHGFERDAVGRVVAHTLPDGLQVGLGWDASGNLTSLQPAGRPAHVATYGPADLLASYTAPTVAGGGVSAEVGHDLDRRISALRREDGSEVTFTYDTAGRLSQALLPQGAITWSYDETTARLTGASDPDGGSLSFSWDGLLQTGTSWQGEVAGSVTRTYDDDMRLATQTVGASTVAYGFDEDGLLVAAGDLTITRSAVNGLVTGTTLAGLVTTVSHNPFGELESIDASHGGQLWSATYTRDLLGRITHIAETIEGQPHAHEYTYDARGRLVEASVDGAGQTFGYDDNSNRVSVDGSAGLSTATYDDQDRLLSRGTWTYTYTAPGELETRTDTAAGATTTFAYDALGRLRTATLSDGSEVSYVIDALGRRVGKRVDGVLQQGFLYDGRLVVAELDGQGTVVSRFIYAGGHVPAAMEKGGVTYRFVVDHLGSPRLVVDAATGAVAQRMDFDVFGNVLLDTAPGFQPFGFAGGLHDAHTGLVRFGHRDYDPASGCWTSKDPIGFAGGDPNLYAYAGSDPVNHIDPSGLLLDILVDIGFIGYDVYRIVKDNVLGDCDNLGENLGSLGLNVVGAVVPGVAGLGMAARAGKAARRAKVADRAADVSRGMARLPKRLRNKMKRIRNQTAAGGNRGITGSVTEADAMRLGERFVGPDHRMMSNGRGLVSQDGLRTFRFPSAKKGINPNTGEPWSKTGAQVNFETKTVRGGPPTSNVHLDVK